MNNPDILKKMQVMRINGEPMTLAEQRRFVKKLGMGRTPADDAREAAARDKRDRRAAKLAAAMAKRVAQFPRPRSTNQGACHEQHQPIERGADVGATSTGVDHS